MTPKTSKISALLLTLALIAVLAACTPATPAQPTQAPAAAAPTAAPAAPTEAAAPTAAPAPTQAQAPTQAPDPTQAPAPTQAAAPVAVSYAKDVQPIFEQSCVKCHGGSDGTKGGLSLKTYADLMNGGQDGQVIAPGDAANSMLVQAITSGKMPKRAAKLPQAQIDAIAAWVAEGAQNN